MIIRRSYYHGFLAGMLKNIGNYIVQSNRESGNGRPDILLKYPSVRGKAVIIEIKISKTYQGLEEKCDEALRQIEEQEYEEALREEGYQDILKYGVAFYKKNAWRKCRNRYQKTAGIHPFWCEIWLFRHNSTIKIMISRVR